MSVTQPLTLPGEALARFREVLGADGFQEQWSAGWAASRAEAIDLADPGRDQVRRR